MFRRIVRQAQNGSVVTITNRDETVAYIVGRDRMAAILETIDILSNPAAARAIADYREGKTQFGKSTTSPNKSRCSSSGQIKLHSKG